MRQLDALRHVCVVGHAASGGASNWRGPRSCVSILPRLSPIEDMCGYGNIPASPQPDIWRSTDADIPASRVLSITEAPTSKILDIRFIMWTVIGTGIAKALVAWDLLGTGAM